MPPRKKKIQPSIDQIIKELQDELQNLRQELNELKEDQSKISGLGLKHAHLFQEAIEDCQDRRDPTI